MPNTDVIRVGVDLDNVCYDFVDNLRRWIHHDTGRELVSMPDAEVWDFMVDQWGMTITEYLDHARRGVAAGTLLWEGPPMRGALEGCAALHDAGCEVHIVTNRETLGPNGLAHQATQHWLEQHTFTYTNLVVAADKGAVAAELGLDFAIDDAAHHYDEFDSAGCTAYLLTRPWNADHPGRRVDSWDMFVEHVLNS